MFIMAGICKRRLHVWCTILTNWNTSVFMVTIVILFLFLEVSFHIKLMLKDTINQKKKKENSVIISSPSRWWKAVLELHSKNSVYIYILSHLLPSLRRMLQRCFAVKLQKGFVCYTWLFISVRVSLNESLSIEVFSSTDESWQRPKTLLRHY